MTIPVGRKVAFVYCSMATLRHVTRKRSPRTQLRPRRLLVLRNCQTGELPVVTA